MDIKKNLIKRLIKTDDDILFIVSHHFISYFYTMVILFIGITILFFLYKFIDIFSNFFASYIVWILWVILYFKFLLDFLDIYLDSVVVTNKSFILYKWFWLLRSTIDIIEFNAIESVYSDQNGLIDTIFDKWDLVVRRAGFENVFEDIENPWKAVSKLNELLYSLRWWELVWEKEQEENNKSEVKGEKWELDIFMQAMEEVIKEYKNKK